MCASVAYCTVPGVDVSAYQGNVNWATVAAAGKKFAYIKATEGTTYTNPNFAQQYDGSYQAGLIRGSYHFAHPNGPSGATQAKYFLANGGGWSGDGKTLPGAVDLEYNPYGTDPCWGISASAMVSWIQDFSNTYHAATGRYPVIYTTTNWWQQCTGNSGAFTNNPLWVARYASAVGTLPNGWAYQSFWQNTDSSTGGGDGDIWNGSLANLQIFAKNA
ncbi:hypothetical protein BGZ49_003785 [Haplosporangium sp. Z 27]|nr:hypothetical protein BGZ49_003785 [Haplosporangium sp. Z 27]